MSSVGGRGERFRRKAKRLEELLAKVTRAVFDVYAKHFPQETFVDPLEGIRFLEERLSGFEAAAEARDIQIAREFDARQKAKRKERALERKVKEAIVLVENLPKAQDNLDAVWRSQVTDILRGVLL